MSNFDYGNARLHAMKSRLLSRKALEEMADVGSVQGLLTALTRTAYRESVEAALVRLTGMECLAEALRSDLVATLERARAFFMEEAGALALVVLNQYDLHNVKTLLRGLAGNLPANEILANTLPIGELRPADLAQLARAANVRTAIDLLATWRLPFVRALLEIHGPQPSRDGGTDLFEMEVALDRWYFHTALAAAGESTLRDALLLDADIANIMTALRLIGAADAPKILRQRFGSDDLTVLFVGPGHVPFTVLADAARRESVSDTVGAFVETPYGETLANAMSLYASSARLSVIERALAQRRLQYAANLFSRDPLGVGVLLGYAALKTNEVNNIRAIAHGLMLGDKSDRIRAELMYTV